MAVVKHKTEKTCCQKSVLNCGLRIKDKTLKLFHSSIPSMLIQKNKYDPTPLSLLMAVSMLQLLLILLKLFIHTTCWKRMPGTKFESLKWNSDRKVECGQKRMQWYEKYTKTYQLYLLFVVPYLSILSGWWFHHLILAAWRKEKLSLYTTVVGFGQIDSSNTAERWIQPTVINFSCLMV